MRHLLETVPLECAIGAVIVLTGLYLRFAPDREQLWGYIELWSRANRAACKERKRVWSGGITEVAENG